MRSSVLYSAPFVAAVAYAQSSSTAETTGPTVVPEISGSVTISSTYTYSNTLTNFLSLTNSDGVVTGMPTLSVNTAPGVAVTSQPALATVPAGLPTGINTVYIGNGSSLSSFQVSVGTSTTVVVGGAASGASVATGSVASVATAGASGSMSGSGSMASGSGSSNPSASRTGSATGSASATSSSAADSIKLASGAVLGGLGALFAAFL